MASVTLSYELRTEPHFAVSVRMLKPGLNSHLLVGRETDRGLGSVTRRSPLARASRWCPRRCEARRGDHVVGRGDRLDLAVLPGLAGPAVPPMQVVFAQRLTML